MIRELRIRGFKRFTDQTVAMGRLTLLTGMNGSGKTSVIHALLLIREATRRTDCIVELNGPHGLELGTCGEIQNWAAPESIRFDIVDDASQQYTWTFGGKQTDLFIQLKDQPPRPPAAFQGGARAFQYLSAERIGPRSISLSSGLPPEHLEVGSRGEYSAQVLHALGSTLIDEPRRFPSKPDNAAALLKFETERWLSSIARPVQINSELLATRTATALSFRIGEEEWVRPPNMGFGVTYALPVVLAGLISGTGGLLIVENPEAHLHPAGQAYIGRFLAAIAAAGVQVLVETHSDHVLNGIRRAIAEHRVLPAADAVVHYFDANGAAPVRLAFTEAGGMASWPPGFFDQYQIDVAALSRVRRPK